MVVERNSWVILLLAGMAYGPVDLAIAQSSDSSSERRSDSNRDRDDDDDDDKKEEKKEERREYSREERRRWWFNRLDRNNDGKVERSEVRDDRSWRWFESAAKEAGLDPSKPISMESYMRARSVNDRKEQRDENPTAFLPPSYSTKVPGFDQPLNEDELLLLNPNKPRPVGFVVDSPSKRSSGGERRESSGERSEGSRSSSSSSGSSVDERAKSFAKSIMDKYDSDGNSIIEGEEYKKMRNPSLVDFNKDGRVTYDEIYKLSSSRSSGSSSTRSSSSSTSRTRTESSRSSSESNNSTYRFTSALDRLSSSARSWVKRYDKNGDGQVAMSEYSSSWSDSRVRDFQKYDVNGDGVITGQEYSSRSR